MKLLITKDLIEHLHSLKELSALMKKLNKATKYLVWKKK